jgi:hypothetical protein
MDDGPDTLDQEGYDALVRRYRGLAAYLAEGIGSLVDPDGTWGFGVTDGLNPEGQYRWLEEVREMQRERTALEDLIIARARAALPYRALPDRPIPAGDGPEGAA